jgi:hypothetical protein
VHTPIVSGEDESSMTDRRRSGDMSETSRVPFDSIESAHEYVGLLCQVLDEAEGAIQVEIESPSAETRARHLDALHLVEYKLKALRQHLIASRRLLTDLRTLRRHLLDERASERVGPQDMISASPSIAWRSAVSEPGT